MCVRVFFIASRSYQLLYTVCTRLYYYLLFYCYNRADTGLYEVHISGDIAFACWQFWQYTQDAANTWLLNVAWPLLSGIATFWVSRATADSPGAVINGRLGHHTGVHDSAAAAPLHICGVIPPDEYGKLFCACCIPTAHRVLFAVHCILLYVYVCVIVVRRINCCRFAIF